MKEKEKFIIYVPRELVRNNTIIDGDLKKGILFSFCYLKRFATWDGLYENTLFRIMQKIGLHYDSSKTALLPKRARIFLDGLDYLKESNIITVLDGDYHELNSLFSLKFNDLEYSDGFVMLKFKDFDYILKNEKRIDKAGLVNTLLFVRSCYNYKDNGFEKESFTACCYSLDKISKKLDVSKLTAYKYLKNLCIEEGFEGDAPLVRSKLWYLVSNERIIRFPNIYVDNDSDSLENIEFQKKYIRRKMLYGKTENDNDLDELFTNPHANDNFDDIY